MQSAREITEPQGEDQAADAAPRSAAVRAGLLFVDFFLIITAYYQLKPASRSLFIEYLGADRLPYVWIATAVVLGAAMVVYHHLVERYSRFGLVVGTSLTFAATLVGFRILLAEPGPVVASAFYVFVDIFSVVLVEQFRIGAYAAGCHPWLIEVVAGIIDPGETAEEVARRETVEEAGLHVSDMIKVADYLASPGGTSETVTLYCGRIDAGEAGGIHGLDTESEDIRVMTLPFEEVAGLLAEPRTHNATLLIALQWLTLHRDELRAKWR